MRPERRPRVTGTTAYPEQGLRSRLVGRNTAAFSVLLAVLFCGPLRAAEIKFATLAPEGTHAMKTMRLIDSELREATSGAVSLKFYAGGRQGDEKDVVRKIRLGQLHSGGFTGVGLGEIAPEVRILDAPWLFNGSAEIDHIYEKFSGEFEKAFQSGGFVLLGWSEVGFVHVFSKTPARTI
ncbi:MAG: TRAP transporter substrate-binding protein DctP, partial [Elusimicrobiota bacterium]